MSARGRPTPKKLKHDAIVEAIFEIRFYTKTIPEILVGQLADYSPWKGFTQGTLPAYALPQQLRETDPNLRFQPLFSLSNGQRTIRIGPNVLSYHRVAPYESWDVFHPEIEETITGLFKKASDLTINRLGLRYLNSLRTDHHSIKSIADLDLQINVANLPILGSVNLNFTSDVTADTACTMRIATPEFIQGVLPGTSVYVDVDLFTKEHLEAKNEADVRMWVKAAHEAEKDQFFSLLTDEQIESLKEE